MIGDTQLHEKIISVKDNTLRSVLLKAGRITGFFTSGTHRHTFVRERFKELLGGSHDEDRKSSLIC